jgi:peptidoglycan/xylan/chitin deacetylase (PgdA/CDA1 family)
MRIYSIKAWLKTLAGAGIYLFVLILMALHAARAQYLEVKLIGIALCVIWVALGIFLVWLFLPQWDPWLRRLRKKFKGRKIVALTFDDGPSEPWTAQILDILKQHDVHATFFVIGEHAKKFPRLVERAHAEGHSIGGHTSSHRILTFLNERERLEEIENSIETIRHILGCRPNFFRLPHGFKFPGIYKVLGEWNLLPISWTKGIWDTDMPSTKVLLKRFANKFDPFEILLLHDGIIDDEPDSNRNALVEALPRMIETYKELGYEFLTVEQLSQKIESQYGKLEEKVIDIDEPSVIEQSIREKAEEKETKHE